MSDQVVYTNPSDQSNQNNNLIWMTIVGFVALIFIVYLLLGNRNNSDNKIIPTQVPQDPQSTQIPQEPQSTQVPQDPQSTQIAQPTSIPTLE